VSPAAVHTLHAVLAHEAGDTLAADADVQPQAELGVDPGGAVGATAARMDLTDLLTKQRV
jgi:hypothetical protein